MSHDYESLLSRRTLRGLTPEQALIAVAFLIDGAFLNKDSKGTEKAIEWCSDLRKRKWWKQLNPQQRGEVDYFESNAWGDFEGFSKRGTPEEWEWSQAEITKQILLLRSALLPEVFEVQCATRQCQILTNLANTLNRIGRTVEALEYWSRAIEIDEEFGMALGNRAKGILTYSDLLYDPGHQVILLRQSMRDASLALSQQLDTQPRDAFAELKAVLSERLEKSDSGWHVPWDKFSLGRSKREREYRLWCLEKRLFLNPLNDIEMRPLAARDVLSLPTLTTSIGAGLPSHLGLFNNLKQEFVSARYLCFEGMQQERTHFSDREVQLTNTLDYPSYGIGREQVKASFRLSYSILNKIGFMVNDYFSFGIQPRNVAFRTMWFKGQKEKNGFLDILHQRPNLPLRGLYWMGRDLFDDKDGFNASGEPAALQLQQIRNHIEHRYLKVHGEMWTEQKSEDPYSDKLAVSIARIDLEAKAVRMLQYARSAIVYLVCAVQVEEMARRHAKPQEAHAPMVLTQWEDQWKI